MPSELEDRRTHVEAKIEELLERLDETMRQLYTSLLENDEPGDIPEERAVSRLEGYHDYIVVREATGVGHPSFEEFIEVKKSHPESLLSFGTGAHRLEVDDVDDVDDTVSDEEMERFEEEGGQLEDEVISADSPDEAEDTEGAVGANEAHEVEEFDDVEESKSVEVEESPNSVVEEVVTPDEEAVDTSSEEDNSKESSDSSEETPENEKVESQAGRIDSDAIVAKQFTEKRGGYNVDKVDDMLDTLSTFLRNDHTAEEYKVQIDKLKERDLKGSTFRAGFVASEVDGFVTALIGELENRKEELG